MLSFLYRTIPGRFLLKLLTARPLSAAAGAFMDSALSKPLIGPFLKKNGIRIEDYEEKRYRSFNDCFTRKIKEKLRPIDMDPASLISPCDGLLSAYTIRNDLVIPVKQSVFRIPDLLGGSPDAAYFRDGICLVFRLCVNHYHRYCYFDDGVKGDNVFLPGVLHTVRPIALENVPVFTQNCREYTIIDTSHFGKAAQIEVGAMLVGRIRNHHGSGSVVRGAEKGMFLYGGSTIILLLAKDEVVIDEAYFRETNGDREIPVKMGMRIGKSTCKSDFPLDTDRIL